MPRLNPELKAKLKLCTDLPSPPGVATKMIELGQSNQASMGDVADVVNVDPALAAKILRVANSPFYARQRKTQNLRQALMLLGLDGALTLALSFSLVKSLSDSQDKGTMDYGCYWRRSLSSAVAARVIAQRLKFDALEDIFLAGLLQDIGMLALSKAIPDEYSALVADSRDHDDLTRREREALGCDHALVGAWLMEQWNLPSHLQSAVAGSHDPGSAQSRSSDQQAVYCIALGSRISDIWLHKDCEVALAEAALMAKELLDIDHDELATILDAVTEDLPVTASLFDVEIADPNLTEHILGQAKEILMLRNLQSMREAKQLSQTAQSLETRTKELEEQNRRDGLTGLYNRAYLDDVLKEEFNRARDHGWPLTVAFVDLDHFKLVNDNYGHQAGDEVLRRAADLMKRTMRDTDIVARYGGEEFVALLPGSNVDAGHTAATRILEAFRHTVMQISSGEQLGVTVSIGTATSGDGTDFEDELDLVRAADQAVYAAKNGGRNRVACHGNIATRNSSPHLLKPLLSAGGRA